MKDSSQRICMFDSRRTFSSGRALADMKRFPSRMIIFFVAGFLIFSYCHWYCFNIFKTTFFSSTDKGTLILQTFIEGSRTPAGNGFVSYMSICLLPMSKPSLRSFVLISEELRFPFKDTLFRMSRDRPVSRLNGRPISIQILTEKFAFHNRSFLYLLFKVSLEPTPSRHTHRNLLNATFNSFY